MDKSKESLSPRQEALLARGINKIMKDAADYFQSYIYSVAEVAYTLNIDTEILEESLKEMMQAQNEQMARAKDEIFAAVDQGTDPSSIKMHLIEEEFKG